MTKDDIIRMAREAGLVSWLPNSNYTDGCWWIEAHEPDDSLEQFAKLIATSEREACAKMCDEFAKESDWPTADNCATAIRARGQ
jgi:hypothetical protein